MIDMQESINEPNSENDQEKENSNLESTNTIMQTVDSETGGIHVNSCDESLISPRSEKTSSAAAEKEITSNIDTAEKHCNTKNDSTGFEQKKGDEKDNQQTVNEEGIEEMQSLLQEFVNSSTNQQTVFDTSRPMDQTGTEAAWSTVGLERCSYCLFTTDQKDLLKTHISSCTRKNKKKEEIHLVYSNDGKYGCKSCLFMTPQRMKFQEHVAFHIFADPYICLTCKVTYSSKKEMEKHVKQIHSNELTSTRCGLKGSKKINKIIEELYITKEVIFNGRKIEKSELNAMIEQNEKNPPATSATTAAADGQIPRTVEDLNTVKDSRSKGVEVESSISKTKGHTILSVPNLPVFATCSSSLSPNPVFSSNASIPVFSMATTVANSNLPTIVSSVHQSVVAQPLTFPRQTTTRGPVLCNVVNNQSQPVILVPVQQIQPRGVLAGPFQLKSGKGQIGSQILPVSQQQFSKLVSISPAPPKLSTAMTSQNQVQRLIVVSSANSPMQSFGHNTNNVKWNEIQGTSPAAVPALGMTSASVSSRNTADRSDTTAGNDCRLLKFSMNQGKNATAENQLLFKKKGKVYCCQSCFLETDLEENFMKHIWVHVHQKNMCKINEHQEYRQNMSCKIVTKIVQGLKVASAAADIEAQKKVSKGVPPVEIVLSSDDEDDAGKEVSVESTSLGKVGEESNVNNENDLQIRITSTFSLSEADTLPADAIAGSQTAETKTNEDVEKTISNKQDMVIPGKEHDQESSPAREIIDHSLLPKDLMTEEKGDTGHENVNVVDGEDERNSITREVQNREERHENISSCSGIDSGLLRQTCNLQQSMNERKDHSSVKIESGMEAKKFYQCGFEGCLFSADTSSHFREHISDKHSGAKEFNCAHCGHKSYTEECHFRHISCHAKNQSGLLFKCGSGCKYASNILKHFKEHLEMVHPSLDSYKCTSCQELFDNIGGLINHCEANKLQFVLCPYCTMRDPNRRTVLKHISTVHPGKPRQITVTAQLVCQEREINSYSAPKPISSPTKPVSPERNIEENEIVDVLNDLPVEIDTIKVEEGDTVDDDELKQPVESDFDHSFAELDASTSTEDRSLMERNGGKSGLGALSRCNKCTYLAGSTLLLRKHKLQHVRPNDKSRPFCCPVCPTSSDSFMKFERHINLHEGYNEIEIYMCELCNYQTNVQDKIKYHLRKSHKGSDMVNDYRTRLMTISVTVYKCEICQNLYKSRKEYLVHMSKHGSSKHKFPLNTPVSIDKFHCDCCSFSCDDRDGLIQHTKVHLSVSNAVSTSSSEEVKPKPKQSYFGPKKPFYIPPGNVFKDFIQCSECPFKTKTRLDLLRHIKCHQNLEPKMKKVQRKEGNILERTRDVVKFQFGKRKQPFEKENLKRRKIIESDSDSEEEANCDTDYTAPKRKQVAMKSTSGANTKKVKQSSFYFLGGDILHKKLQPCFTKEEDEPMYQCVMCSDVFEDRYSLHKHILDHMNISFYKCNYCDHGELEISAMVTHIQRTHRKPIKHTRVQLEEVEDDINRAIHEMKAKEYWGESVPLSDIKPNVSDQEKSSYQIDQRQSSNIQSPKSTSFQNSPRLNRAKPKENAPTPEKNKLPECVIPFGSIYRCTVCNQEASQSYILVRHAMTHCSVKRFLCPYCEKRSHYRSDICKHIHLKHKGKEVRVTFDKANVKYDSEYISPTIMQQILAVPDCNPGKTMPKKDDVEKNVEHVKIEKENEIDALSTDIGDKKAKKVVVGYRTVFKCLLCKTTFKGKGKIYKHIRETKCKRPIWRCSACKTRKFRSDKERVIKDHIKEVHQTSKDAKPVLCAINGKIRKHTMPTMAPQYRAINEDTQTGEFKSERAVKEKEMHGAIATVLRRDDMWKCSNCDYATNSRTNCVRHTFTHSKFKKFGCPTCSFRAKSSRNVKNHLRNCHPREKIRYRIYNEVNSSPKKNPKGCNENSVTSSPQRTSYQCRDCGFVTERKSSLSKHINAKCSAPLKGCSKCDFTTSNESEMKKHVKRSHKAATVTDVPLSEKVIIMTADDEGGSPEKANRTKVGFPTKIKPIVKNLQSKPLSNEFKLWIEENEEQSINCPVCNKVFHELRTFRDHFAIEHKDKQLLCGECEEYAAKLPSLIFRHARLFHNQTRLQDLSIKAVSQKTIEEKGLHQRLVILYKCPKCGKVSRRCPLRRHMYIHYNYNPYQCNHCEMKCKMPRKIQSHLAKIHPDKPVTDFTFRKNLKLEKEISTILDSSRYQTLSKKSRLSATMGKNEQSTSVESIPKINIKREDIEEENEQEEESDNNEEEEEDENQSEEEEEGEPRGDLKNMFSPCHNYKMEFDKRRQKTIYKCSICPYQSTVNKTMVTHFYHHVPHVFKCPYCVFQGYPR